MFFNTYFETLSSIVCSLPSERLDELVVKLQNVGGREHSKVIVVGNGGSAAIASHVAVDYTKAAGIPTMCFSDAGMLTCFGNDYGYEHWVTNALRFYAKPSDLIILISSSGESENMVNGAEWCRDHELELVTLTGFDENNALSAFGDLNFHAASHEYNFVELTHLTWLLAAGDRLRTKCEY